MQKPPLGIAILLIGLIGFISYTLWNQRGVDPPAAVNQSKMMALEAALLTHHEANGSFPATLAELNLEDDALIDSWENPFIYEAAESGEAILTSRGLDGKLGGGFINQDLVRTIEAPE